MDSEKDDQTGLRTCTPLAGNTKQGKGDDEADDNGSGDGDEQGNEDSAIQGGDSTIRGGDSKPDRWLCRGRDLTWTREHRTPRRQLFNPDEAERGPSNVNQLWYVRKTIGVMKDGRKFNVTDDWTRGGYEGACMIRQAWTGRTTFIMRTPEGRLDMMQTTKQ